ncbi:MAG: hypothetical protein IJF65_07560 [Clostridia bacterium]|nr:hypothetical protein [Clostridia bacterium]
MFQSSLLPGPALREHLETAYQLGQLEEALRLSLLMDEMQLQQLEKELNRQPVAV